MWTATLRDGQRIAQAWGAAVAIGNGTHVSAENLGWSGSVQAGSRVKLSFVATTTGPVTVPPVSCSAHD